MRLVFTVARRELAATFASPLGIVFLLAFLVGTQWLYLRYLFPENLASMDRFFSPLPWMLMVFLPVLTMRAWAEERKLGTFEVLMTYPVSDVQVVLGKWLASFGFALLALALTAPMAVTLAVIGEPDLGQIAAQYAGAVLLSAAFLAVGQFASSLTDNQMVAFLVTAVFLFALYITAQSVVVNFVPYAIAQVVSVVGFVPHYESLTRGVVDTRDLVYFASFTWLFLHLTVWRVGRRA